MVVRYYDLYKKERKKERKKLYLFSSRNKHSYKDYNRHLFILKYTEGIKKKQASSISQPKSSPYLDGLTTYTETVTQTCSEPPPPPMIVLIFLVSPALALCIADSL